MQTAMHLQHVPPVPRCMVMSFALTRHHENHTSRRRMLNAIISYPDNIKLGMNGKLNKMINNILIQDLMWQLNVRRSDRRLTGIALWISCVKIKLMVFVRC